MIIGITGCPGSGKSALAADLAMRGWALIDADEIGREVVESDPAVLEDLADAFGGDVLDISELYKGGVLRVPTGPGLGIDESKLQECDP